MRVSELNPGIKVSERSLENEGFGMESREWCTVIVTCRMIFPFEERKELCI